jgi:hypothetical protein
MQNYDTRKPENIKAPLNIFSRRALKHIFIGDVDPKNKKRRLSGMHYAPSVLLRRRAKLIRRTVNDWKGVYLATVALGGRRHRRCTVFFPDSWTRKDVLSEIRSVYNCRPSDHTGCYWQALSTRGVMIKLHINGKGKIVTAYPIRETRKWHCRRCHKKRAWGTTCARCGHTPRHLLDSLDCGMLSSENRIDQSGAVIAQVM